MSILGMMLTSTLLCAPTLTACGDKAITDFSFSSETLRDHPFEEIRDAETISLDDLVDKDRLATFQRIQSLPKLTSLSFYNCDLSKVTENDPVPKHVKFVLIAGSRVSQGTIGWLAKFPSGTALTFGCDVHGLKFTLGKFSWLTFDNCKISRSAVLKLLETMTQVTFKEVQLVDDK